MRVNLWVLLSGCPQMATGTTCEAPARVMLISMPQNTVTFVGTVASEVTVSGESPDRIARFQLKLTTRRVDRSRNAWVISDRTYVAVVCRQRLAGTVATFLQRGDPVVVTGALRTRRGTRGVLRLEVDAHAIGQDLGRMSGADPGGAA